MRAAVCALLLAGCTVSGTGVALTVDGPGLAVDDLRVVAAYGGHSVTHDVAVTGALPTALLAELPDADTQVTFTVTGFHAGVAVGEGASPAVDVKAHHIASATVTLSNGGGDGGGGPDGGGGDGGPMFPWTRQRGGLTPLAANAITGVWGAAATDVYATCKLGGGVNLFHSGDRGATWIGSLAGTTMTSLNAVWGLSANEVYLAGDGGLLLKGSGASWTPQTSPASTGTITLNAVWGSGVALDVYAVGASQMILHSVAGGWIEQGTAGATVLYGVWGSSASDVYAVGSGGVILHSTGGGTWTGQTSHVTTDLRGVWGSGPNDVYIVGDNGTLLHSTGGGVWTTQTNGVPSTIGLQAVWGSSAADVYAVGSSWTILRSSGLGAWAAEANGLVVDDATTDRFFAVWGSGASDVFAVGAGQTILHRP